MVYKKKKGTQKQVGREAGKGIHKAESMHRLTGKGMAGCLSTRLSPLPSPFLSLFSRQPSVREEPLGWTQSGKWKPSHSFPVAGNLRCSSGVARSMPCSPSPNEKTSPLLSFSPFRALYSSPLSEPHRRIRGSPSSHFLDEESGVSVCRSA